MTEKQKFIDWLNSLLKPEYQNERYYNAAWNELQEKDACGQSFEIPAADALTGRPYLYRVS